MTILLECLRGLGDKNLLASASYLLIATRPVGESRPDLLVIWDKLIPAEAEAKAEAASFSVSVLSLIATRPIAKRPIAQRPNLRAN